MLKLIGYSEQITLQMIKMVITRKPRKNHRQRLMNYSLPDLFSSTHVVYKLKAGLRVVVACCCINYSYFFFWQNSIKDHAGSSYEYFSLFCKWVTCSISCLHVTSRRPYWWWRTKAFHFAGNYTLFSCTCFEKNKFCFIDRQHGRLVNQELQLSDSSSVIREVHFQ